MDFSQITGLLPDSALGYLNLAGIVIGAGSVACASISKYTKNKTDDKIASWLKKAHDLLGFVGLHPKLDEKRAGAVRSPRIRDHRAPK